MDKILPKYDKKVYDEKQKVKDRLDILTIDNVFQEERKKITDKYLLEEYTMLQRILDESEEETEKEEEPREEETEEEEEQTEEEDDDEEEQTEDDDEE